MQKIFLLAGAFLAFTGVAAGAFGAHALKQKLSTDLLNAFEVGVRYQMYHALALIALGILYSNVNYQNSMISASGWSFIVGTIIFSGSLYILALSGVRIWGAITPIGGVFLLVGWLLFALGVYR